MQIILAGDPHLKVWVHVKTRSTEVVGPGDVRDNTLSVVGM